MGVMVIVKVLLLLSAGVATILTVIYAIRPDIFAAVTVLPAWAWVLLVLPLIPFLRRKHIRQALACVFMWAIFAVLHVEEPRSVLRGVFSPAMSQKGGEGIIRLVTFNCGGGQRDALEEVKVLEPDIVFLQESPPRKDVDGLSRDLFGGEGASIWDYDTSIIGRGDLRNLRTECGTPFYSLALLTSPGFGKVRVVSLRLWTNNPRIDLWNPGCWKNQRELRERQLQQMMQIMVDQIDSGPLVIAGDFNAPQGDKVFSLLPDTLYDTFGAQGRGMGNTIINNIPLLRIDQIWVSRDFETVQSFAVRSNVSDHRIVVSDVRMKE